MGKGMGIIMNIVITAYRPDGYDHGDRSNSDFQYIATESRIEAKTFLYNIFKENYLNRKLREVDDYEIQIFINGVHSFGDTYYDDYHEYANEIVEDAENKLELWIEKEQIKKEFENKQKQQMEEEKLRQSELALLKALKKKYE